MRFDNCEQAIKTVSKNEEIMVKIMQNRGNQNELIEKLIGKSDNDDTTIEETAFRRKKHKLKSLRNLNGKRSIDHNRSSVGGQSSIN
jgi:hypothetical protein